MSETKRNGITQAFLKMDASDQVAFLKSILDSPTEYSIIAIDLNGTIVAMNKTALNMYGYKWSEMIGKSIFILSPPDVVKSGRAQALLDEAKKATRWTGEVSRIRKNKEQFPAFITINLRKDGNGNALGFTIISRDISQSHELLNKLKASQNELRLRNLELEEKNLKIQEVNRLKTEFLANMSHDLRTPLNGIIGFTELLIHGKVGPLLDNQTEYLNDILSSARHLLYLINDILDLTKIESGKMDFFPETINFNKIFRETKEIFGVILNKKDLSFEYHVDPNLKKIVLDLGKLKQIIYNYVSNAIKFTPEHGHITIRVLPEGENKFRLEVKDTGIGIQKKDFDKLYVPFQQLDTGLSKNYSGTGLGLALIRRIAEAQEGTVGVDTIFGKGSTFYAILPCQYLKQERDAT